jgi:alpha-tubulin suppressor-like RCC1 family protein
MKTFLLRKTTTLIIMFLAITLIFAGCGGGGNPLSPPDDPPTPAPKVISVSAGTFHALALKDDGTVWAWGSNCNGQIGNGTEADVSAHFDEPVQVVGPDDEEYLTDIVAVKAERNFSLALKDDGTVWSWGANDKGQLGDGTRTERIRPVQAVGLENVESIYTNYNAVYAIDKDGYLWMWGQNNGYLFDDWSFTDNDAPVQVPGLEGVRYITGSNPLIGGQCFAAVTSEGTVWTWGSNSNGQLGDDTWVDNSEVPVQVVGPEGVGYLENISSIAIGDSYILALRENKTVWAWGYGGAGRLGDGTDSSGYMINTPVQVLGAQGEGFLTNVEKIWAHKEGATSFAVQQDGTLLIWGNTWIYDEVLDDWEYSTAPMIMGENIAGVFSFEVSRIYAVKNDGSLETWGNPGVHDNMFTIKDLASDIVGIYYGGQSYFALESNGTVWSWGFYEEGPPVKVFEPVE